MELTAFATFFKAILENPRSTGAACPSSKKLARKMASFVSPKTKGLVIELGPGTGVVTQALLTHGIPPTQLLAIEYSKNLAYLLKEKFPTAHIIHGDASHLYQILRSKSLENHNVEYIVSGLPLRSLPKKTVEDVESQIHRVLTSGGFYIQFTYDIRPSIPCIFKNFERIETKVIWTNLPPARVDLFRKK